MDVVASTASTNKCSLKQLEEYRNGVNDYLIRKNIKEFSKYEISIKDE